MNIPIILYNLDKEIISNKSIIRNHSFYFYSFQNFSVKIISGNGKIYSVLQIEVLGINSLDIQNGQELTGNFGYTIFIPDNKSTLVIEISNLIETKQFTITLELDNIIDETNEHYNDLLINNYLPTFTELEKCIPIEFDKANLLKRLLLDFKSILRHKGTKTSIEKTLNFLGFNNTNLKIYGEYLNRKSNSVTLNPNKATDIKTGNYHVIYDNFTEDEELDSNNMPQRYIIIEDLEKFTESMFNAIALINIYFTCEEQEIILFALKYSSNISNWSTISSSFNMIIKNDVLDFRKNININANIYFSSVLDEKIIVNCLQKTDQLYKSEVKYFLNDLSSKTNSEIFFIDNEIFDDLPLDNNLDLTKIQRVFGNILHLNIQALNTYVVFELYDKNNPFSKLIFSKQYITEELVKTIVLTKTSDYRLIVDIYDEYNNLEKYFYDFSININIQKIDFEIYNSTILKPDDDKNNITLDVDSQEEINEVPELITNPKNFIVTPIEEIPENVETYFDTPITEFFRWLTENKNYELPSINQNHILDSITESISLDLIDNWLSIFTLKYVIGYTLKLRIYNKELNENKIIELFEIQQYDKSFDNIYVVVLDIFDRNSDNSIQEIKTPYYFITSTETGIDFNQKTYDFVLVNNLDNTIVYSIYNLPESIPYILVEQKPIKYGGLYNWNVVSKNGGIGIGSIAPIGWHIPTKNDFEILINQLNGDLLGISVDILNENGFNIIYSGIRSPLGLFSIYQYECFWIYYDINMNPLYASTFNVMTTVATISTQLKKTGESIRLLKNTNDWIEGETVTDIDNNIYGTIKIGNQVWTTENLNVTHFNDGILIPNIIDSNIWVESIIPSMCYFNNDNNLFEIINIFSDLSIKLIEKKIPVNHDFSLFPILSEIITEYIPYVSSNENVYTEETILSETSTIVKLGALYNDKVAYHINFIAPIGWHLPTQNDLIILTAELGGMDIAGGKMKEIGFIYWEVPNTGATNSSGFGAKGAGARNNWEGNFTNLNLNTYYRSQPPIANYYGDSYNINTYGSKLFISSLNNAMMDINTGTSLRFIKDDSDDTGSVIGNDGTIYPTIKIGNQVWMAVNSIETKFRLAIVSKLGYLYNFDAITDSRKIYNNARIPTTIEYQTLITYFGSDHPPANINDFKWVFNLLELGGYRYMDGVFYNKDIQEQIWAIDGNALCIYNEELNEATISTPHKMDGCTVRLIVNTPIEYMGNYGIYVGNDGRRYRCIFIDDGIGNANWWLFDALIETKFANGDFITNIKDMGDWAIAGPARCSYDNDDLNAFVNDNKIPIITDDIEWSYCNTPAMCAFNNDWTNSHTTTEIIEIVQRPTIKSLFTRLINVSDDIYNLNYSMKIYDIILCRLNDKYVVNSKDIVWKVFNSFTNELLFETKEYALKYQITDNLCFDISCTFLVNGIPYTIFKKSLFSSFQSEYLIK
jgi:uncharacterized protein (TIGR02145 family)